MLRLIAYSGTPIEKGWVINASEYKALRDKGNAGRTDDGAGRSGYPDSTFYGAMSIHPSFGLNGIFVGGDTNHSAFKAHGTSRCGQDSILANANPANQGGKFYLTRLNEVQFPSDLIILGGSRAGDTSGTSFFNNGRTAANNLTAQRDGFYKIMPNALVPESDPDHAYGVTMVPGWAPNAPTVFNPKLPQSTWGYLNARYFGTVAISRFDGSANRMKLEALKPMKHWDNYFVRNTNSAGVYNWRLR